MSGHNCFSWLSASISVSECAPDAWSGHQLTEFYENPNDVRWGGLLCRQLMHETLHFWHVLSSGFLANLVGSEWKRLVDFEKSGNVVPAGHLVERMHSKGDDSHFSPSELMECWARFWDVHIRSPATIIREEKLDVPADAALDSSRYREGGYTGTAFDFFMQNGPDSELYAAPFRWLLERCDRDSTLANLLFPPLAFFAFQRRDPVEVFVRAMDIAMRSAEVRDLPSRSPSNGVINVDWLYALPVIVKEVIIPAYRDTPPTFGWEVMGRGLLRTHPVYGSYAARWDVLSHDCQNHFWTTTLTDDARLDEFLISVMKQNPHVLQIYPGQPLYRFILSRYLPAPRISFANITHHKDVRPLPPNALGEKSGPDIQQVFALLDARIKRFKSAEYAVSVGLPANAFE